MNKYSDFQNEDVSLLVYLLIFLIIVIVIVVKREHKKQVYELSVKIRAIQNLNASYSFFSIPNPIEVKNTCSSKKQFDNADLDQFLISCIQESLGEYQEYLDREHRNKTLYEQYFIKYMAILNNTSPYEYDLYNKYSYFQKIENKACSALKLNPTISICVKAVKSYVSPQGRNSYYDYKLFDSEELKSAMDESKRRLTLKDIKKDAKSLYKTVPLSLRFAVFQRDDFRCVLCGASSPDGVNLVIDHLIPVSKGGKTEMSNLRTLCNKCFYGKSGKYDPHGSI